MGESTMWFSVMAKRISLILMVLFFYSYSYAASVELKTGQIIEGKIVEITDDYIKINSQGVSMSYITSEIESIEYEENEVSSLAQIDKDPTSFTIKKVAECILQEKTDLVKEVLEDGLRREKNGPNKFALTKFKEFIDNSTNGLVDKDYFYHFLKMIDFWSGQQYQDASSEFQEALRIDSTDPFIYFVFANISFAAGNAEETTKNMRKALELYQIKGDSQAAELIKNFLQSPLP